MKHIKRTTITLTALAALYAGNATAASGEAGLQACVDALMSEVSATNGAPVNHRMRRAIPGIKPLGRRTTFHVDAVDPVTQRVVARADCVVNSRAQVLQLTPIENSAPGAPVRARKAYYSFNN
ncbi:hypothetical protein [Elongatibacter sediminis]|uniref:Uncharacterized protein n=1 Tax=Elongatibacter sediminis TaxID=3119006 RepID=A0AAW9RIH8_9GAMM